MASSTLTVRAFLSVSLFLLSISTFSIVSAQAPSPTPSSTSTTGATNPSSINSSTSAPTSTQRTPVGNRITWTSLPSCVSSCISSAIPAIPCTPFVASCFCALPTGKVAYELPEECVATSCGGADVQSESAWKAGICSSIATVTATGEVIGTDGGFTVEVGWDTTVSAVMGEETETCGSGWIGCPIGLNGGCCPAGNDCNLLDCQPQSPPSTTTTTNPSNPNSAPATFTASSEIPYITLSSLIPPCAQECIANYLPRTSCGLSPLNSTCFCRLHDMFPCFSSCPSSQIDDFITQQMTICHDLWYFTPYAKQSWRWCDLVEGPGGKPWGFDIRVGGSLEGKCPNWWDVKSKGQKFGICFGFLIAGYFFSWGCCGFWESTAKRVDRKEKKLKQERRKMMGLS